jgi:hypothetical protein
MANVLAFRRSLFASSRWGEGHALRGSAEFKQSCVKRNGRAVQARPSGLFLFDALF